eukprot:2878308-Pleurochrysis_carterae.AAC.3
MRRKDWPSSTQRRSAACVTPTGTASPAAVPSATYPAQRCGGAARVKLKAGHKPSRTQRGAAGIYHPAQQSDYFCSALEY